MLALRLILKHSLNCSLLLLPTTESLPLPPLCLWPSVMTLWPWGQTVCHIGWWMIQISAESLLCPYVSEKSQILPELYYRHERLWKLFDVIKIKTNSEPVHCVYVCRGRSAGLWWWASSGNRRSVLAEMQQRLKPSCLTFTSTHSVSVAMAKCSASSSVYCFIRKLFYWS